MEILNNSGSVPLPPYIKRESLLADEKRYQTIFASESGAVAAPTAGLHFTDSLLEEISSNGIEIGYLTLHVGAGTFMPLREEQLETKKLHKEQFIIDRILCEKIDKARSNQGRVIAVGTTVVRALESIAKQGQIEAFQGETDIFITPGFEFKVIDAMVTNFHLPESSLIMLVSAFAGAQTILKSYQHAINSGYRFYSYGDAMFLEKQRQ
jgi:S-adenosylmethionine:tRNA ribosyltransferase-isomerase